MKISDALFSMVRGGF